MRCWRNRKLPCCKVCQTAWSSLITHKRLLVRDVVASRLLLQTRFVLAPASRGACKRLLLFDWAHAFDQTGPAPSSGTVRAKAGGHLGDSLFR